jgi:single-strand DNA-binding protein
MIDCLLSGRLIRDPMLQAGKSGKPFCQFLLTVPVQDSEPVVISGIAFSETAQRIALLKKGDALSIVGSLKPSEWQDKNTGETKHGLSITASNSLSVYDIQKRRKPAPEPDQAGKPSHGDQDMPFDDPLSF